MKYFTLIILLLCSSCKKEKNTFYSLDEYSLKGTQYYDIKKDKGPYIFLKRHKDSLYVSILGIEKDKSFTRIYTNEGNYWYREPQPLPSAPAG